MLPGLSSCFTVLDAKCQLTRFNASVQQAVVTGQRPDGSRLMELMNASLIWYSRDMVKSSSDKNCIYTVVSIGGSDQDVPGISFANLLAGMDIYLLRPA